MLLHLKVKPGQQFDKVEKVGDGWQIRLRAAPVKGKANEYLIAYLSKILNISRSQIALKKGHTAKFKTLEITLDESEVLTKLESELYRLK